MNNNNIDPVSLDASIAACKRFWKMQAKPSFSKKERMQQEVDKLYGRDTHQDDADSAQNGEGENVVHHSRCCAPGPSWRVSTGPVVPA